MRREQRREPVPLFPPLSKGLAGNGTWNKFVLFLFHCDPPSFFLPIFFDFSPFAALSSLFLSIHPVFSPSWCSVLTCPPALCSGSCCTSPDSWLVCWRGCGPLRPALCMCNPRFDPDSPEPLPCPCLSCLPPACAGPCAARPSGSSGPLRPSVDPQPLHLGLGRP